MLLPEAWRFQRASCQSRFDPPDRSSSFFQVARLNMRRNELGPYRLANDYFAMLADVGVINWYTPVVYGEAAEPRLFLGREPRALPNPKYRGEVWVFEGECEVVDYRFTANRWRIRYAARSPATLVVNQNWHKGWRREGQPVARHGKLIALPIARAGQGEVEIVFRSAAFEVGAAASVGTLALALAGLWARPRLRRAGRKTAAQDGA